MALVLGLSGACECQCVLVFSQVSLLYLGLRDWRSDTW